MFDLLVAPLTQASRSDIFRFNFDTSDRSFRELHHQRGAVAHLLQFPLYWR